MNIFSVFSGTGQIFKSLEEVVSSEEISERTAVLRVCNEISAEISNIFRELVTDLEGTQTRATLVDVVSIEVIAQEVSEMLRLEQ